MIFTCIDDIKNKSGEQKDKTLLVKFANIIAMIPYVSEMNQDKKNEIKSFCNSQIKANVFNINVAATVIQKLVNVGIYTTNDLYVVTQLFNGKGDSSNIENLWNTLCSVKAANTNENNLSDMFFCIHSSLGTVPEKDRSADLFKKCIEVIVKSKSFGDALTKYMKNQNGYITPVKSILAEALDLFKKLQDEYKLNCPSAKDVCDSVLESFKLCLQANKKSEDEIKTYLNTWEEILTKQLKKIPGPGLKENKKEENEDNKKEEKTINSMDDVRETIIGGLNNFIENPTTRVDIFDRKDNVPWLLQIIDKINSQASPKKFVFETKDQINKLIELLKKVNCNLSIHPDDGTIYFLNSLVKEKMLSLEDLKIFIKFMKKVYFQINRFCDKALLGVDNDYTWNMLDLLKSSGDNNKVNYFKDFCSVISDTDINLPTQSPAYIGQFVADNFFGSENNDISGIINEINSNDIISIIVLKSDANNSHHIYKLLEGKELSSEELGDITKGFQMAISQFLSGLLLFKKDEKLLETISLDITNCKLAYSKKGQKVSEDNINEFATQLAAKITKQLKDEKKYRQLFITRLDDLNLDLCREVSKSFIEDYTNFKISSVDDFLSVKLRLVSFWANKPNIEPKYKRLKFDNLTEQEKKQFYNIQLSADAVEKIIDKYVEFRQNQKVELSKESKEYKETINTFKNLLTKIRGYKISASCFINLVNNCFESPLGITDVEDMLDYVDLQESAKKKIMPSALRNLLDKLDGSPDKRCMDLFVKNTDFGLKNFEHDICADIICDLVKKSEQYQDGKLFKYEYCFSLLLTDILFSDDKDSIYYSFSEVIKQYIENIDKNQKYVKINKILEALATKLKTLGFNGIKIELIDKREIKFTNNEIKKEKENNDNSNKNLNNNKVNKNNNNNNKNINFMDYASDSISGNENKRETENKNENNIVNTNNTGQETGNPYTLPVFWGLFPIIPSIIFGVKIRNKQGKLDVGNVFLIIVGLIPGISVIVFGIMACLYNHIHSKGPQNIQTTDNMSKNDIGGDEKNKESANQSFQQSNKTKTKVENEK